MNIECRTGNRKITKGVVSTFDIPCSIFCGSEKILIKPIVAILPLCQVYSKARRCNQQGYALPTVIVIALIISVITMSIAFSVREKTAVALEMVDRSSACLKSYSAYNETLYNILTSTFTSTGLKIYQEDGSELAWNLYGEPIELAEGVTVELRDGAGMLSPLFHPGYLRKLMEYTCKDSKKINSFVDTLADWQDTDDLKRLNGAESYDYRMKGYSCRPRNFYIQVTQEILLLRGFDPELFGKIRDDIVYWGGGNINYLTMSEKLLRALLENDLLVDRIIRIRKEGKLTGRIFSSLTGIPETEENIYAPSGWIKVKITAKVGKAVDRIEAVVKKRGSAKRPYMVSEWKK